MSVNSFRNTRRGFKEAARFIGADASPEEFENPFKRTFHAKRLRIASDSAHCWLFV